MTQVFDVEDYITSKIDEKTGTAFVVSKVGSNDLKSISLEEDIYQPKWVYVKREVTDFNTAGYTVGKIVPEKVYHIQDLKGTKIKEYNGEVESIENGMALLAIKDDSEYFEYEIGVNQLTAENVNYEGAPIILSFQEVGNKTIIEVRARSGAKPPWSVPNEDIIHVLKRLKDSIPPKNS